MEISTLFVKLFISLAGLSIFMKTRTRSSHKFTQNLREYKQINVLQFSGEHQKMVMFSEEMQKINLVTSHKI